MAKRLTPEQERVLLHKHISGDFPGQKWETINALFRSGMIEETSKRISLTVAGKEYCNTHHLTM